MSDLIFGMAFGGVMFCLMRLVDVAWPTKILSWRFYAVLGTIWLVLAVSFYPSKTDCTHGVLQPECIWPAPGGF